MKLQDLLTGFGSLSSQRKILFLFLFGSVVGGMGLFGLFATRVEYGVLYSNLEEQDAAKVLSFLQEERIPYKLQAGGRIIQVPQDKLYELRLRLAAQGGVSRGGVVGFEIFDKESWGESRFVQGVNYRRALEGELARTIMSIEEVERARVHLVLPERSPFVGTQEAKPKASVVLKLRGKGQLEPSQVKGIVHLVSGSVDGLLSEDVSVVDTEGRLLTRVNDSGEDVGVIASSYQLEYKKALEGSLEQSVTQMLERIAGIGNAVVRVSAQVDFRKIEKQEEIYDPDSAVIRSEQNRTEKTAGVTSEGAPGLEENVPGDAGSTVVLESPSEKKEKVLNYEINKVVKHMVESPGAIQRLSVAVLLQKQDKIQDADIERILSLVRNAVGFDEKRGDQVEVAFMPLESNVPAGEPEPSVPTREQTVEKVLPYAWKYGGPILGVLILVFAVFRPLLARLAEEGKGLAEFQQQLPKNFEQLEKRLPERAGREELLEMVKKDPGKAAQIIRLWLREG
jgi:flagellar M-ring protein FliF